MISYRLHAHERFSVHLCHKAKSGLVLPKSVSINKSHPDLSRKSCEYLWPIYRYLHTFNLNSRFGMGTVITDCLTQISK